MKGMLTTAGFVCAAVSFWGTTAHAEGPANPLATPWSRPQATYVVTHPSLPGYRGSDAVTSVSNFSKIIYLNNCAGYGCAVDPGDDDAIHNTSGIPSQPSVVQPWNAGSAAWQQLVQCVKATYAPFDVEIVTERPPAGTNYHMAIVAGRPQDVQMGSGVGGVSEFTCGYIPNGISFSFANIYGGNVDEICWTVAQETAHSWGLDHKFDNRDPMTYLQSGPSRKTFQNASGACGELSARKCQCGGSTMNSFQEILDTFGASTPTPPTVTIDSPRNGDTVDKRFPIQVSIVDDLGVQKAELYIDGKLEQPVLMNPPFTWTAGTTVGQGAHAIKVIGYDVAGTPQVATANVSIGVPCGAAQACLDDGQVCVDGRCVAGSGTDGGLGAACTGTEQCISQACASDGDGHAYCVESCDLAAQACPAGFECTAAGASGGVCWPTSTGGCNASGASSSGMSFFVLCAAALITRRRRR